MSDTSRRNAPLPSATTPLYSPLEHEKIHLLFEKFGSLLSHSDPNVLESLNIIYPISFSPQLISLLNQHCRKGNEEHNLIDSETLGLDSGVEEEAKIAMDVEGKMDKRHASDLKLIISQLFPRDTTLDSTCYTFYSNNKIWIDRLDDIESKFSMTLGEKAATNALIGIDEKEGEEVVVVNESIKAPLPNFTEISMRMPGLHKSLPIKVDSATAAYLASKTEEIISGNFNAVIDGLKGMAGRSGYILIQIGTISMNVSASILLWLIKFLYDKAIKGAGTIGGYFNKVINLILGYQETLFGSPFMNFTNPTPEDSKDRRANRIVYIYLYAMIDLLLTIKKIITGKTKNKKQKVGLEKKLKELAPNDEYIKFIKNAKDWSLDEILRIGPDLFNLIHGSRDKLEMKQLLSQYYSYYDQSIGVVTHLLDLRIFDAKIKMNTLITLLTPLSIVQDAPEIREASREQVGEIQAAIYQMNYLGMIEEPQRRLLTRLGYAVPGASGASEPEPEPGFGAKKKRTRRRRKSKSQNSTKSKKKKGKKRKQTQRGRKKK